MKLADLGTAHQELESRKDQARTQAEPADLLKCHITHPQKTSHSDLGNLEKEKKKPAGFSFTLLENVSVCASAPLRSEFTNVSMQPSVTSTSFFKEVCKTQNKNLHCFGGGGVFFCFVFLSRLSENVC